MSNVGEGIWVCIIRSDTFHNDRNSVCSDASIQYTRPFINRFKGRVTKMCRRLTRVFRSSSLVAYQGFLNQFFRHFILNARSQEGRVPQIDDFLVQRVSSLNTKKSFHIVQSVHCEMNYKFYQYNKKYIAHLLVLIEFVMQMPLAVRQAV